jgi:hypothetical protein
MNETFIRLVAALAFCGTNEPGNDEYARWTVVLQGIYRLRDVQAHSFLAAINLAGLPNESPSELLLRAHQHAKQLLPQLLAEYREAKKKEAADTNKNKFLRQQAESDPFLQDANLTRDAYSGRGELEPDPPTLLDPWGNVR